VFGAILGLTCFARRIEKSIFIMGIKRGNKENSVDTEYRSKRIRLAGNLIIKYSGIGVKG
jgi:hypothetical protein